MTDAISEFMPKSEMFWMTIGFLIVIICSWKTRQINAVITILKDPKFKDLPEEEKIEQINYLTVALYAYGITLMCFLTYLFVSLWG